MFIFLKRVFLFSIKFLIITAITSFLLEYIIYCNTKEEQYLLQADWHVKHKKVNNVLFIGNSRTWVQVDVKLFSKETKLKSYALAQDGRNAKLLWYKFKKYLELNFKPDRLFLQFDPTFIDADLNKQTFYGKENYLSYLFWNNLKISEIFSDEIGFIKYEEFIPLIRYANFKELFFSHLFKSQEVNSTIWSNKSSSFLFGSNPQDWSWNQNPEWKSYWNDPEKNTYKNLNFAYIDSFGILCKKKAIQLILVYPPQSYTSYKSQDNRFIIDLTDYARKEEIPYFNFNSNLYNDSTIFYNHMHLNKEGSKIYTFQIIHELVNCKK